MIVRSVEQRSTARTPGSCLERENHVESGASNPIGTEGGRSYAEACGGQDHAQLAQGAERIGQ